MNPARSRIAVLVFLIVATPCAGFAETGEPGPASLHGRHALAARLGVFNHGSIAVSSGTAGSSTRVSGFAGYGSYAYGVAPEWMVGVTAGSLDAEVLSSVTPGSVISSVASVTPILFEARWYPLGLAMGSTGRPFFGAAIGPYIGSAINAIVGSQGSSGTITESVVGGRAQAGIDWIVGRRFLLEVAGGYHLVGEFDEPIGSETDYSGAEFTFGIGILFGTPR